MSHSTLWTVPVVLYYDDGIAALEDWDACLQSEAIRDPHNWAVPILLRAARYDAPSIGSTYRIFDDTASILRTASAKTVSFACMLLLPYGAATALDSCVVDHSIIFCAFR